MKQGRLEYFLISENLTNIVESTSIKSGYRSTKALKYESPEGTWGFSKKKAISKSLYRIMQSVLTD